MLGHGSLPILGLREFFPCGDYHTAAIGLIDHNPLVRSLSPELMLVDPELAERARALLREPGAANGKGEGMSALGTHEITSGMSIGLEPPLSPPIVRGPNASALPSGDGLSGLPLPPPAIRPPEAAPEAPPAPEAELVPEPNPVQPAPEPTILPPEPVEALPEPVQAQPEPLLPAPAPEPELPSMAPEQPAEPVVDYFATPEPEAAPEPVAEPVSELPELPAVMPVIPATVEEPVDLPSMAPEVETQPEPMIDLTPAAFFSAEAVDAEPEHAPEPEPILTELLRAMPTIEPAAPVQPEPVPSVDELFAPQRSEFKVVVRLKDGEGVEVGSFRDFGTAMEGAQEVIEQFSTATDGQWPFYAGRFIRPDLIVSVDVVEG